MEKQRKGQEVHTELCAIQNFTLDAYLGDNVGTAWGCKANIYVCQLPGIHHNWSLRPNTCDQNSKLLCFDVHLPLTPVRMGSVFSWVYFLSLRRVNLELPAHLEYLEWLWVLHLTYCTLNCLYKCLFSSIELECHFWLEHLIAVPTM